MSLQLNQSYHQRANLPEDIVVVKLYHDNEIRRIKMNVSRTFWEFRDIVCELTGFQADELKLYYFDQESDWIRFSTEEEWADVRQSCFTKPIIHFPKFKVDSLKNPENNEQKSTEKARDDATSLNSSSQINLDMEKTTNSLSKEQTSGIGYDHSSESWLSYNQDPSYANLNSQQSPLQKENSSSANLSTTSPINMDSINSQEDMFKDDPPPYSAISSIDENKDDGMEDSVRLIQTMGFSDENLIRKLLVMFNGNISQVVKSLHANS